VRPRGVLELRALPFGPAGGEAGVGWAERERWFALEPSTLAALPCGFMGDETTPFERAARRGARSGRGCAVVVPRPACPSTLHAPIEDLLLIHGPAVVAAVQPGVVQPRVHALQVLTAIFEGYDRLIQPAEQCALSAAEQECFFAFVDRQSHDLLLYESAGKVDKRGGGPLVRRAAAGGAGGAPPRVGVWQLLLLEGAMPFRSARRNSRVPKLLPHRLFPEARHALWLDSKLELHMPPSALVTRLLGGGVVFAALRNFRRDHIQEERDWIWRHKCEQKVERCDALIRQWRAYADEQEAPAWEARTAAIEGCLLLQDLRAPLANLIFCSWWNEYVRYGERDQLALAYVLLRLGLTREDGTTAPAIRLLPRSMHYLQKPSQRELHIVKKLGHRDGSRKVPGGVRV
jgi:hypothetical protein